MTAPVTAPVTTPAMTPEIAREMYGDIAAEALLRIYDADRRGALSVMPLNFVDVSATVGERTKVWAFARVLADVVLGDDVMIGGGTEIGRGSTIGDGARIQANCFLPSHSTIGPKVFIGPGVVFTDDRYPYVHGPKDPAYTAEPPIVEEGASIGAGAVICPGVRIGRHARVAAGSVITADVAPFTTVAGLPARVRETPNGWRYAEPEPCDDRFAGLPDFP